jgi:N-methylhydantoinase A
MLDELLPGVPYTLSHRLNPIVREYRRASSTAIDASLKPLMQRHLGEMADDLRAAGFRGELLVVTSFGGVLGVDDVVARPIHSVNSGPSMGPVAGKVYADGADAIVCDMGGTSFDVSVIRDGYIKFTRETWLGPRWTGHMTGLSSVDVTSIGAGGGSIAWIDPGGLLRVGPRSAGSVPGPACYALGGTEPTVTDAGVALGYLDPRYFLGGRVPLSEELAQEAIRQRVAGPLGLTVERAAWSILAVANEHMVTAIRDITINEGLDPRSAVIVSGGGAGGMTIGEIAGQLGCDRVLVPRTAGALSACGGRFSDIVTEFSTSCRSDTNRFDRAAVGAALASLDRQMDEFFGRLGAEPDQCRKELFVEARYPYQVWELDVPLAVSRIDSDDDVAGLAEAFHRVHERVFAVAEPGQHIECINWKGRATISLPQPRMPRAHASAGGSPPARTHRRAFFGEQPVDTPIFFADDLAAGHQLGGPAILEEATTTVVVYPGWSLRVTETGDYALARERATA